MGGTITPAQHALGGSSNASHWLSASNRSHGAPNISGKPVIIDLEAMRRAGATIVDEAALIADLERYANQNPSMSKTIAPVMCSAR